MKRLNILFTLYSLVAFLIIVERLSPTTNLLLQPFNFIHLHEINQTVIFLPLVIIISLLQIREITNNFQHIGTKNHILALTLFVVGAYIYGAGEGWHEVASFTLNYHCHLKSLVGNLCNGLFINDYYAGNIIFFVGGVMMNISLLFFAFKHQS